MTDDRRAAYSDGWYAGTNLVTNSTTEELRELGKCHRDLSRPLPAELGQALRISASLAVTPIPVDVHDEGERFVRAIDRYSNWATGLGSGKPAPSRRASALLSAVDAAADAIRARARDEGIDPDAERTRPLDTDPDFARGFMDAVHDHCDEHGIR